MKGIHLALGFTCFFRYSNQSYKAIIAATRAPTVAPTQSPVSMWVLRLKSRAEAHIEGHASHPFSHGVPLFVNNLGYRQASPRSSLFINRLTRTGRPRRTTTLSPTMCGSLVKTTGSSTTTSTTWTPMGGTRQEVNWYVGGLPCCSWDIRL